MGDIERPWNAERDAQRAAQVREAQVATQRGYKTLWILLTVFIISGLALGIAVVNAGQSSRSSDPIEQARVVLGGAYTYDEVKSVTDSALVATGTAVNDDTRNRAWSAVLTLTENLSGVAPMEVMQCVEELGLASDMDFPDTAALCATSISLGG